MKTALKKYSFRKTRPKKGGDAACLAAMQRLAHRNCMKCELCTTQHPHEIWRDDLLYVIDASDDALPCFIRVISTQHKAEMTDLPQQDRAYIFNVLMLIEKSIREIVCPDKINLASLGNMVPHVHWHIIARWKDDAFFPDSIWSERHREMPLENFEHRKSAADQLLKILPKRLDALRLEQMAINTRNARSS